MAIDSKPLPALAHTAITLATSEYDRVVKTIERQTLAAMGLLPSDGWTIDWVMGEAARMIEERSETPPPSEAT